MLMHRAGPPNEPSLADVMRTLQIIVEQNELLNTRSLDIQSRVEKLEARSFGVKSLQNQRRPQGDHQEWRCPVCYIVLKHADSFKGHIRSLLPANISTRPKCYLKPFEPQHISLVHRFEGRNFNEQADNFIVAFYGFVRCAVTSSFSVQQSLAHIASWISAALAEDDRPFPELPRVSSSDQHNKRANRTTEGDASDDSPG
jgi:hypothetical protein